MKVENIKAIKYNGVVRRHTHNENEYKKVYLTPFEAEKFFDLGKNVQIEEFHYKNKVYVKYVVYIHINTLADNCL
jgi:hypothetical protein